MLSDSAYFWLVPWGVIILLELIFFFSEKFFESRNHILYFFGFLPETPGRQSLLFNVIKSID